MNVFKKALIESPKTYEASGWPLAPAITNTQDFYEEFMGRLSQLTMMFAGWGSSWSIDGLASPSQFTLSCVCLHGQSVHVAISSYLMMNAPTGGGGIAMADDAFARMKKICDTMHAHIPPPGQFLHTLAQSEPIGYSSPYVPGGFIKMDDFKEMYAAEYAKQIEYITQYQWYSGASMTAGYVTTNYGYGNGSGSILGTLLKICPGLGSVRRPCPETKCSEYGSTELPLSNMIQHVNDQHEWSREKIAEWLDIIALDDPNVDLTIKPNKEIKHAQPSIGSGQEFDIAEELGGVLGSNDYPF